MNNLQSQQNSQRKQKNSSQTSSGSLADGEEIPDFFLYTTLNQNQTKDLKKANTNKEERQIIEKIFNLNAIKNNSKDQVNKVDQLILDFHCINYEFCVKNQYSNEKVSTLLSIMDFILKTMIKHQLQVEKGIRLLKKILQKHSLQRPPYSIFIFSLEEINQIVEFMLQTFFRHYSMYEYSFKPKVDLFLQTLPQKVESRKDLKEASTLNQEINNENINTAHRQNLSDMSYISKGDKKGENLTTLGHNSQDLQDQLKSESVDHKYIGKLYKPESTIEEILKREMQRLQASVDTLIINQDVELEEKLRKRKQ